MYNKLILLTALFLFLLPGKVSTSGDNKNFAIQAKSSNNSVISSTGLQSQNDINQYLIIELQATVSSARNHHSSDDDGKTHYYHFNRLNKRKCRAIYCFVAKIILLIAHTCFLISSFIHATS